MRTGESDAHPTVPLEAEIARPREADPSLRLHALLLDSIHAAVIATDLDGHVVFWNRFAERLYRLPTAEALGKPICDLELAGDGRGRETLDGWSGDFLPSRSNGSSGPADADYRPLFGEDGQKIGTVIVAFDGTERKREQERAALLVGELHHRLKNTLATVLAIIRSTGRTATTIEGFQRSLAGRVESLAKTHALLAKQPSEAADLHALLEAELGPYRDGSGRRVRLSGPSVSLPSTVAVPFALALHELATNAAKYGSLSNAEGWLEVNWTLLHGGDGASLVMNWSERGGVPVVQPRKSGFGSELLRRVLRGQIGADVETSYAFDGLRLKVAISVPRA